MISTQWYSECGSRTCELRTAGPLDLLAFKLGGYAEAGDVVNDRLGRERLAPAQIQRASELRRVIRAWLGVCGGGTKLSTAGSSLTSGGEILKGQESMCLLTEDGVAAISRLASLTHADVVGEFRTGETAFAYILQTVPWAIDHMVVRQQKSSVTCSWVAGRSGFGGLIGLTGVGCRRICHSPDAAMTLQRRRRGCGVLEEVGYWQEMGSDALPTPDFQARKLMLVVDTADAMVSGSKVLGRMGVEGLVKATGSRDLLGLLPDAAATPLRWSSTRLGFIERSVKSVDTRLSPETVYLLEASAPPREEISKLASRYQRRGRLTLANEILTHLDNRVLFSERGRTIRETAASYVLETKEGKCTIANFSLRFLHNLIFRDSSDSYHVAQAVCGRDAAELVIRGVALDTPKLLQDDLRNQYATRGASNQTYPVISHTSEFRKYVLPHLRRTVGNLGAIEGVSALGWTVDRQAYHLPGMMVELNGRRTARSHFHPAASALKLFENDMEWPDSCAGEIPQAARELIAMTLALCVRYYLRMAVHPLCVNNTSPARALALILSKAWGQRDVYASNANVRDTTPTPGVRGYPILVHGYSYQQAPNISSPMVLLTDGGYEGSGEELYGMSETIGRSTRHSLLRVAEWLLATEGEGYLEVPSTDYNNSLLREGGWLMENVCRSQPWETQVADAVDTWLAAHDCDELCASMRLTADMRLIIPPDLVCDGLAAGLLALDDTVEEGESIVGSATKLVPAFSRFYGRKMLVALEED